MKVRFEVPGEPQPQGNKTAYRVGGKTVLVEGRRGPARKRFKDWRAAVATAARAAAGDQAPSSDSVRVRLTFRFQRPKSHLTKKGRLRKGKPVGKITRPDIDKLVRAILDACTGILWDDDSRVVAIETSKEWTRNNPGVSVFAEELTWSEESPLFFRAEQGETR